jgi:hypothetical protein
MSTTFTALQSTLSSGNIPARVIARGNPGQSSLLTLSSFNETHFYTTDAQQNYMDISTVMVENAVYEILFMGFGGTGVNNDVILTPNFGSFTSGVFTNSYWASEQGNASNPMYASQGIHGFYFDHNFGVLGGSPCGRYTLYNTRDGKMAHYHGGDTASICIGTCRWNDTITQWTSVGRLSVNAVSNSLKVWVRRVA